MPSSWSMTIMTRMITASVAEAKARLSELLRLVAQGETVVILNRGRPVGRLLAPEPEVERQSRWLELEQRGVLRQGAEPPDARILDDAAPRVPSEASILGALLDERESGR